MLDLEFDQPIADRTLDSNIGKIVVKLGPTPTDQAGMWCCPYKIEGLPDEANYTMFGGGIDTIPAITIARANLGSGRNDKTSNEIWLRSWMVTDTSGSASRTSEHTLDRPVSVLRAYHLQQQHHHRS
jgi:hypothetical protein